MGKVIDTVMAVYFRQVQTLEFWHFVWKHNFESDDIDINMNVFDFMSQSYSLYKEIYEYVDSLDKIPKGFTEIIDKINSFREMLIKSFNPYISIMYCNSLENAINSLYEMIPNEVKYNGLVNSLLTINRELESYSKGEKNVDIENLIKLMSATENEIQYFREYSSLPLKAYRKMRRLLLELSSNVEWLFTRKYSAKDLIDKKNNI